MRGARAIVAGAALAAAATVGASVLPTSHEAVPVVGPAAAAPTSSTTPVRPAATSDGLVAVGGARVHLRCVGAGDVTVVLVAGWGDGGEGWGAVETGIGARARVCSYARPGTGSSTEQRTPQTFATQADSLHELLDVAGEPGPYVVVGQSFGGAEAVTFAAQHPDEVTGLVLVDASPATWPTSVCSVPAWAGLCATMHDPSLDPERVDVFPAFEAVAAIGSLGDLPMAVVTGAHRRAPELSAEELARLDAAWADGQERWAGLSTVSTVVTVEDTGHHIEVDRPAIVVDEIVRLLP